MTSAPVPLAEQPTALDVVRRIRNKMGGDYFMREDEAAGLLDCIFDEIRTATLQQHERAMAALRESVRLQSHYAALLNMYDEGNRRIFESAEEWIEQLVENAG